MLPSGRQVAIAVVPAGGQLSNSGFSVSLTVTVNVQVAVPQLLVAVQTTVVVPTGKR